MKVSIMHNEQSSAATSPSEPRRKAEISEADYLAREVADAKAALTHTMADLKDGLSTSVDLRLWVKHYPWAALGAASVAGFAAAAAVTPAPGESVGEKLSRLKPNAQAAASEEATRPPVAGPAKSSTVKATIMDSLFDLAKTLIQTIVIATLRNPGAAAGQDPKVRAAPAGDTWRARAG